MNPRYSRQAGEEWRYCADLARRNTKPVDLDKLYLCVAHSSRPNVGRVDLISMLNRGEIPNDRDSVLRYKFYRFKDEYIRRDRDNFRLFFQAYDGADCVEIFGERSFRRLFMAIRTLGLPIPGVIDVDDRTFYPPVLRFFYGPEDFDPTQQPAVVRRSRSRSPAERPSRERKKRKTGRDAGDDDFDGFSSDGSDHREEEEPEDEREDKLEEEAESSPIVISDDQDEDEALQNRVMYLYDFGRRRDRSGIHNKAWHDLYADIAGIDRQRIHPSDKAHEYKPPYSMISLPPYQTYPVGWMFGDHRRILYYLADQPGLGKTYTAIEAMIRIMVILSLGIDIKAEYDGLHADMAAPRHIHDKDHWNFPRNAQCRADTIRRYGVVCPCSPNSPTHALSTGDIFGLGYMLIIVRADLVTEWVEAIQAFLHPNFVLPHNLSPIEVLDITDKVNNERQALRDFLAGSRSHAGLGSICITSETTLRDAVSLASGPTVLSQQPCIITFDEAHQYITQTTETPRLIRNLVRKALSPVHVLAISGTPIGAGNVNFETIESIAMLQKFETWFGGRHQYIHQLDESRDALDTQTAILGADIRIGKSKEGLDLTRQEEADTWRLITAYDQSGIQYANALPFLQRKQGDNYFDHRIPVLSPKSNPPQVVPFHSPMTSQQRAIARRFRQFLRERLQDRIKVWNEQNVVTRGPIPTMASTIFSLEPYFRVNAHDAAYYGTRIDTSLVAFAPRLEQDITEALQEAQARAQGGARARRLPPQAPLLRAPMVDRIFSRSQINTQRQIVQNSDYGGLGSNKFKRNQENVLADKINRICQIIQTMINDNDPHEGRNPDLPPLRKKAIICVPYSWHAYILMAFLFERFPNKNFTYVGAGMTKKQRGKMREPFRRQTTEDDARERDPQDPIALISTYRYVAEGHNLHRCNYLISTSPLASSLDEQQLFARINRRGQYCDTHTYTFVDHGDPADVIMYHRNRNRTAITVPEDERLTGLQFLLEGTDNENPQLIE